MQWLPDYGVGMFAMATLTYSGPSAPISAAWDVMLKTGGLRKRELPPTTRQTEMREHVFNLWKRWDDAEAKPIVAVNFFLDKPPSQRQAEIQALKARSGVHDRRSDAARELAARTIRDAVREGHRWRVLHAGADAAADDAASGVSKVGVSRGNHGRADRRAGGRIMHALAWDRDRPMRP